MDPEATHAVLRMASNRDVVVDNFHAGGVAASVDVPTGKLGRATDMGLGKDTRWWDVHPVTGARIEGRILPFWNEVLALARHAHEAFADHVAIGWDIALLQNGPHLVEGNKSPDLRHHSTLLPRARRQLPLREPFCVPRETHWGDLRHESRRRYRKDE
jgi:hypothetical protein